MRVRTIVHRLRQTMDWRWSLHRPFLLNESLPLFHPLLHPLWASTGFFRFSHHHSLPSPVRRDDLLELRHNQLSLSPPACFRQRHFTVPPNARVLSPPTSPFLFRRVNFCGPCIYHLDPLHLHFCTRAFSPTYNVPVFIAFYQYSYE